MSYGRPVSEREQFGAPRTVSAQLRSFGGRNVVNWKFVLGDSPRIHELQLQHTPTNSVKVIYFNTKRVHSSSEYTRDWSWTARLYERSHPVKIIIDYSSQRGNCSYDLQMRALVTE